MTAAFTEVGGLVFTGDDAWEHLREAAQPNMRRFLKEYVETPLKALFDAHLPDEPLPSLKVSDRGNEVVFSVGAYKWHVARDESPDATLAVPDDVPDAAGDFLAGM